MSQENDENNYIQLTGCPISYEVIADATSLSDSFLISHKSSENSRYRQFKIGYQQLRQAIGSAIVDHSQFGSMAYELSGDYSPQNHDHYGRYNYVQVEQNYKRNYSVSEDDDTVVVLGHVVVDGRSYDICYPRRQIIDKPSVPIGTLKFLAVPNLPPISETDADFNGWVYPDGRAVEKTRFPLAYSVFGGTYGETDETFNLPTLSNFMELNPRTQVQDSNEFVEYNLGMAQHSHNIESVNLQGSFQLSASVATHQQTASGGHHHGIRTSSTDATLPAVVQFDCNNVKLQSNQFTEPNSAKDVENYPEYNMIPVLMYIGTPNNA